MTEGEYGNVGVKQETPEGVTVKYEMLPSGSESGEDSDPVKGEMLPSGSVSGADNVTVTLKNEMLPSRLGFGMADTSPQCPTGTLNTGQLGRKFI